MNMRVMINKIAFPIIKYLRGKNKFTFEDKSYEYFIHENSWNTERVVEIPIILDYIEKNKNKRILEFGNVLEQFIPINWDVLDKYSNGSRVIHQDIVDFTPEEKYDLIISISTLEHVGFNEDVENIGHGADKIEQNKILIALKNIKENCLNPNGKLIITVPLGYNNYLDKEILNHNFGFDKLIFMKRLTRNNKWAETAFLEKDIVYGHPFNNANYICVCEYDNTNNI